MNTYVVLVTPGAMAWLSLAGRVAAGEIMSEGFMASPRRTQAPSTSTETEHGNRTSDLFSPARLIKCEIHFQDIHAGFAKNTEISLVGVQLNQIAHLVLTYTASFGDPGSLQLRVAHADVRIESAA